MDNLMGKKVKLTFDDGVSDEIKNRWHNVVYDHGGHVEIEYAGMPEDMDVIVEKERILECKDREENYNG